MPTLYSDSGEGESNGTYDKLNQEMGQMYTIIGGDKCNIKSVIKRHTVMPCVIVKKIMNFHIKEAKGFIQSQI